MKTVRALGLVILLLAGAGPALAADAWAPYSNAKFGLSTSFPSPPTVTEETTAETDTQVGMVTTLITAEPDSRRAYSLQLTRATQPPQDPGGKLDVLAESLGQQMGMPVISQQRFEYQGLMALDAVMGPSEQGVYLRGRYILRGADLIQILSVRQGEAPPLDQFYTDFKLSP